MILLSAISTNHQQLYSYHHLCTNTQLYALEISAVITPWGYSSNKSDGEALHQWAHTVDLKLLFDHKKPKPYHSEVWNTYTNPDLTFYTCDVNSLLLHLVHKIGGIFAKSQHRPTVIHTQLQ